MSGWGIVHQFSLEVIESVLIGILFWGGSSMLLSAFPLTVFLSETSFSTIWFSDMCILGFACKSLISSTSGWCLLLCGCHFIKIHSGEDTGKVVLELSIYRKWTFTHGACSLWQCIIRNDYHVGFLTVFLSSVMQEVCLILKLTGLIAKWHHYISQFGHFLLGCMEWFCSWQHHIYIEIWFLEKGPQSLWM